jgi:hypothetical protein
MPPVTRKMPDPQDDWQHVLGKVLLYEKHDNIRSGLTALGIKDITKNWRILKAFSISFIPLKTSLMIQQQNTWEAFP